MNIVLTKKNVAGIAFVWVALFATFSVMRWNPFQVLNIFGFVTLIFLPGLLTLFLLHFKKLTFWEHVSLAVGMSLLELMVMGLMGNTTLPLFGVMRPLDREPLIIEFVVLIGILVGLIWSFRNEEVHIRIRRYVLFDSLRDVAIASGSLIFVALSIFGAMRLNNDGSSSITLCMLGGMAIYFVLLVWQSHKKLNESVMSIVLFCMALALLLMTSLRGWHITGHDIQREYAVFEMTKLSGIWNIEHYRNAYNACMSITIVPTIFSNLLKISDPYIYKVYFQILFAIVPGTLFVVFRKYLSDSLSFLSVVYFISFPTFFNDMPFLNRQGVAFLFLSLMVFVIFSEKFPTRKKRALFSAFGAGMVLSHYSTTYTVLGVLAFLVFVQIILWKYGAWVRRIGLFSGSSIAALSQKKYVHTPLVTFWVVLLIGGITFFWSSIITDTASGTLSKVVKETFLAIKNHTGNGLHSSDVNVSIFSFKKVDPEVLFENYVEGAHKIPQVEATKQLYFSTDVSLKYQVKAVPEETIPLTYIGKQTFAGGVAVADAVTILRQLLTKLLQVFIVIGVMYVLFSKYPIKKYLDIEFALMAIGHAILLVAVVVLPVLSVEYGLFRAFQQALIFLAPFMVIGSIAVFVRVRVPFQLVFGTAFTLFFFVSTTGFLPQLLGGSSPQLNMNNTGLYYNIYYEHESELVGIHWLDAYVNKAPEKTPVIVQSDYFSAQKIQSVTELLPLDDIYPELVRKDAYVFLGYTNARKQQATINYDSTQIAYQYPIQFLDENKNRIYDSGDVKIYR